MNKFGLAILLSFLFSNYSCSSRHPVPIAFGEDQCHYCRMTITHQQYGAEMITDKGRALKYDALECLVNQLSEQAQSYKVLYTIPYDLPGQLYPVDSLLYIISPEFRSPMGANLAAFSNQEGSENQHDADLTWEDILKTLGKK